MAVIYSTEQGKLCRQCGKTAHTGHCDTSEQILGDGKVRIMRETKGRKGAGVTCIRGLALTQDELKALLKQCQQSCGVGGSLKNGVLELQGDQREKLLKLLNEKGFAAKISGA